MGRKRTTFSEDKNARNEKITKMKKESNAVRKIAFDGTAPMTKTSSRVLGAALQFLTGKSIEEV